jgi:predicted aspartyl protease/adenylate kinase family enzyme
LQIKIAGEEIQALVDTGCELSILNENLNNKLKYAGLQCLELPTQHVNLVSAFNDKSKRVKKQALLEVNIGGTKLDQVVLLSAQLLTETILGLDFLNNYETEISFPQRRITLRVHDEVFDFEFAGTKETPDNRFCDLGLMSVLPQTKHPSTAVNKGPCNTKNSATGVADESVLDQKRENGTCMEDSEYLLDDDKECECMLNDDNEASIQQRIRNCAAKHERGCKFYRKSCATFAEVMGSQNTDNLVANEYELIRDSNDNNNEVDDRASLCLATACPKTDDITSPQGPGTNKLGTDDRTVSENNFALKFARATACQLSNRKTYITC